MSAQHTPGPWAVSTSQDSGSADCSFNIFPEGRNHLANICRLETNGIGGFESTRAGDVAIAAANARLIAAAPELLHHLRILAEEDSQCASDWVKKKKVARAAIAKAEGREL